MNNQQIKAKILEDIEAAQKQGFTLITGEWGDYDSRCSCPLGCVNLVNGTSPEATFDGGVRSILEVNDKWLQSFIDGYDGNGRAKSAEEPEAWQMGSEIKEQLHPMSYEEYIRTIELED